VPHILIAADAEWVIDDVRSALETPDTTFVVCRRGQDVATAAKSQTPDLAVLDLQIGNMGGMAVCMNLRLDESGGRLPHVRVLMLLDRAADTFLARRAGAEGWLVKPLDSLRLRRAAATILRGGKVYEGMPPGQIAPTDEAARKDEVAPTDEVAADGEGPPSAGGPAAEEESPRGDEVPAG
jgi:DNA-binding response OmpR family regulator